MQLMRRFAVALVLTLLAPFLAAAPAFAQAKDAKAPVAVQKEFDAFLTKFRAAVKANDAAAIAGLARLPFQGDASVRDAAQFSAKIHRTYFTAKNRACLQRGKAEYERDGEKNDNYFIFCGELIFTFTKTPTGFLFTDIGVND